MDIKHKANSLAKKYDTRNPFEIARDMGIQVIKEDLGSVYGYYNKCFRIKQIHINHSLPEHLQLFTAGHELGHAVLHPNTNTPFLRKHTYFSVDRLETEANKFAIELIIPDTKLNEYENFTLEQLERVFGYNSELLKLKGELTGTRKHQLK